MLEDERKEWQDIMKELMVLKEDAADLQKRFDKLYDKVDEKLEEKET